MCNPLPSAKTCCQCEASRPASDFLPCPQSDDGLTKRCRPCVLANAARDRAAREARQAARAAEAPRKAKGGRKHSAVPYPPPHLQTPASAAQRCPIERVSA